MMRMLFLIEIFNIKQLNEAVTETQNVYMEVGRKMSNPDKLFGYLRLLRTFIAEH